MKTPSKATVWRCTFRLRLAPKLGMTVSLGETVVRRREILQPIREREHPLADRDGRQDVVHQVRRPLGHPPPAAARADAVTLAGKRYEALERAMRATHPGKTAGCAKAGIRPGRAQR